MKYYLLIAILFITVWIPKSVHGQSKSKQTVFVIVHGAWGGSWQFKKVDSLLTAKGAKVYRPSLTGQGERVHLYNEQVNLQTHINDVVNTILFENLTDVVLVGHSYGGMVITGVADSLAGRIRKLIYLDAFLPENGESVFTIFKEGKAYFESESKNGRIYTPLVNLNTPIPHNVPQPLKTFSDSLVLHHKLTIPLLYIQTVAKGTDPAKDDFASQAARAKKRGIKILYLDADHNPQLTTPVALANLLYSNK